VAEARALRIMVVVVVSTRDFGCKRANEEQLGNNRPAQFPGPAQSRKR
jgi:hypothetical protein